MIRRIGLPGEVSNSKNFTNQLNRRTRMEPIDLEKYKSFVGLHKGESFIICGCGVSINNFNPDEISILFGVNDINRKIKTKYLLCVNEVHTFKRGRFQYIENHNSDYIFTQIKHLPINRPETAVYFQLGDRDSVSIDNIGRIDFTANSPYMAAIIAYQMGASKIGLIGIDLTEHHFFEQTGKHLLTDRHLIVDNEYRKLGEALKNKGVKIANLSSISKITSCPYLTHEEFNKL